jgi:hypothetical protein
VADTPLSGTGDDFLGFWNWVYKTPFLLASTGGQVWYDRWGGEENYAAQVLGTVP